MPEHNFGPLRGRLETFEIDSPALRDNLLGDPSSRLVHVYLPESYDQGKQRYPLFVALAGFTGSGAKLLSWRAFGESLPQRLERLVKEGRMGEAVCALPDCFTSLGGNQYVDSPAMGRWESFLVDDLIPALEGRYRLRRGRTHRAVFGKSSGGYGALVQGMRHADHWCAVACHSGDMAFEWCYLPDLPRALTALAPFDGDVSAFLSHLRSSPMVRGDEMHTLMTLAMAASYGPNTSAPLGIELPVDPRTCALDVKEWARWLDHDPVRMARLPQVQESLRRLDGLFVDCGNRDEYNLLYGARQLADALEQAAIPHRYEEFEGGHSGTDHRLDESLPFLWKAVAGEGTYGGVESDGPGAARSSGMASRRPQVAPPGGVPGGCPKCRTEQMRQEVHSGVEIDRCPTCKGIFLDQGEMEALFSAEIASEIDGLTCSGVSEMMDTAIAWCMRCGKEMGPVRTIAGVLVNVCDRCGTVFLDEGELAALDLFRS